MTVRAHVAGAQYETAGVVATIEDHATQLVYFTRDFLAYGFGRLSCAVRVSSTGRKRQTSSLTSTPAHLFALAYITVTA